MRLINADVLESHELLEPMRNGEYEYAEVVYKDDIDDAPTIDAVEVVRCKDCYHAENDTTHMFCTYYYRKVYEDDYCSYAIERRERIVKHEDKDKGWYPILG